MDDELRVTFQQPFDMINVSSVVRGHKKAAGNTSDGLFDEWLSFVDSFRTFCLTPTPEMIAIYNGLHELPLVG